MVSDHNKIVLIRLHQQYFGTPPEEIVRLSPNSGSSRHYYRLFNKNSNCIGTSNNDIAENQSFLYLSDHFRQQGLPVPKVYITDHGKQHYLQQDLGDQSLFSLIKDGVQPEHEPILRQSLEFLVSFQFGSTDKLDFNRCYPVSQFDQRSALWDLNYFKYLFIKLSGIPLDEPALEKEFSVLLEYLFKDIPKAFMYRDFQSRNIMIHNHQPWFIDFQGGRKGHPAYDVASLLYQSRIPLQETTRQPLLEHYLDCAESLSPVDRDDFRIKLPGFALIRLLQTLGAYGFRGLHERKLLFIKPIGATIHNLLKLLPSVPSAYKPEYIESLLKEILPNFTPDKMENGPLTISIQSFSYMRGIPKDPKGHGGGFVFDCRALPNPHRDPNLRPYTGLDIHVQSWLDGHQVVGDFLKQCSLLVKASAENYLQREFQHLQISFGCTGGKHRSVYCAEKLADQLRKWNSAIQVECKHLGPDFEP